MPKNPKIVLAINYVDFKDEDKKNRQDFAISVLLRNKTKNVQLVSFNYENDVVELPSSFKVFKMLELHWRKPKKNC